MKLIMKYVMCNKVINKNVSNENYYTVHVRGSSMSVGR